MKAVPKISIVTPSFNQGHFIEETITSILDQHYPNLEYCIIDGGSTDNTVEIIKKYGAHLKLWVSEKDGGQANAINKGLLHCTGEIFNWVNSDDYMEPGSLEKIAVAFEDPGTAMVAGKVRSFSSTESITEQNENLSAGGLLGWKVGVRFIQPGVWLRRHLLQKAGGIDEQFNYSFDWDLYIRYLYHFPLVKEIPELLMHFRIHDDSKTGSATAKFDAEQIRIAEKLSQEEEYILLRKACMDKLGKKAWTDFLSDLSKADASFPVKFLTVLAQLPQRDRSLFFSRQTAGALKAFLHKRII